MRPGNNFAHANRGVATCANLGLIGQSRLKSYYQDMIFSSGLILGLHTAEERRRYKIMPSLIGWVQT